MPLIQPGDHFDRGWSSPLARQQTTYRWPAPSSPILNAVVIIGVVLWLLNVLGLFSGLSTIHIGR